MLIRKLKKTMVGSLLMLVSTAASAQDLLAKQAPVDRKIKNVDSILLHKFIYNTDVNTLNFAEELYDEWSNDLTHYRNSTLLPDEFKIDLRNFTMPTDSKQVTSVYGQRWGRLHAGLDIKVYIGDTIRAAFDGKVRIVKYDARGYGKFVVIRHPNGLETYYGHLSKQLVKENQDVKSGEPIGLGGNTGRSTGSHLHFETRLCGISINPAEMFDFKNQDVTDDYYVFTKKTHPQKTTTGMYVHKVRKGESLSSIARKHGTTVAALCQLNHVSRNTRLVSGQILKYK
jgi:murein DD-endopeptidase MepM/ murein hydrolase activator NlpD